MDWLAADSSEIICHLEIENRRTLDAYRAQPRYVREHVQIEQSTAQGGYENRQLYELIQNGSDALQGSDKGGRIELVLTRDSLYCANEGEPLSIDGLETILGSHMSTKRGNEIGRFGLGFKSVLAVTSAPRFYSRSGSFGFDAQGSLDAIRDVVVDADEGPVLRLAWPLDCTLEAKRDKVLAELTDWATTVVHLPLSCDPAVLAADMAAFPAEFLLFSDHVARVRLRNQVQKTTRSLATAKVNGDVVLTDGTDESRWRVFETDVYPSDEAKANSGDRADRDTLPLSWAVPLDGTPAPGAFWAFFPTEYQSTLRGILNSPWKTTADRQNLQHALLNQELLEAAAQLVVANLPHLSTVEDPGAHLDAMPSRLEDAKQWADEILNERIYELARQAPVIPDWAGDLVPITAVDLLPAALGGADLSNVIDTGLETRFCHPTVLTRTRHARARRLCGEPLSIEVALETLAHTGSAGSAAAIQILVALREHLSTRDFDFVVKRADVIEATDGTLHQARQDAIYLPNAEHTDLGLPVVAGAVYEHEGLSEALASLGLTRPTNETAIHACLNLGQVDWDLVWRLIRELDDTRREGLLSKLEPSEIMVRAQDDTWRAVDTMLLPGPTAGNNDPRFTVDVDYHQGMARGFAALGLFDHVEPRRASRSDPHLNRFRNDCRLRFHTARSGSPRFGYINFEREGEVAGPIGALADGSIELRLRVTTAFLEYCTRPGWLMTHDTRSDVYGYEDYGPPERWLVTRHGLVQSSLGPRRVDECVSPTLSDYSELIPVADVDPTIAEVLGMPAEPASLDKAMIAQLLASVDQEDFSPPSVGLAYELAALVGFERPTTLVTSDGNAPSDEVVVCADHLIAEHLRASGVPVLEVGLRTSQILEEHWGVRPVNDAATETIEARDPTTPEPLIDIYDRLRDRLSGSGLEVSRCAGIIRRLSSEAGLLEETVRVWLDGRTLLAVDDASDKEILDYLDQQLALGLSEAERDEIAEPAEDKRRQALIERVRAQPTLSLRLAALVTKEQLRRRLADDLVRGVLGEAEPAAEDLAHILLAVHGTHALRHLSEELRISGLEPPARWRGSARAEAFVRELGFPAAFSGAEERHRPEFERVSGAVDLPPLHDYQLEVVSALEPVLKSTNGKRVLVTLPTGAGKTRVMVESLIREMREKPRAQVVWIAQRDELCEQAVQAWSELWRALGPQELELSIGRLWGGRRLLTLDRPSVIVSTYQTLRNRIARDDHAWLSEPDWVVIDEAHGATTASYTKIRSDLGLGGRDRKRPLIGLTATPFRGTSESETEDLARLFGRNLIDPFDGDGLRILQDRRVLAMADHELLAGVDIELTSTEAAHLERFSSLPDSVEDWLGRNPVRNQAILDSVLGLPADWPVLLFASSVHQAEVLAAQLTLAGTPAQAISGTTDHDARRFAIDEFGRGGVRVLTNYAVLHQGFDAPKVRAVYICRPTFSPATYQQMIGRGLRGPLNGGSERCLVVDMGDNITRFGGRMAFRSFDYLWARS